MSEPTPSTRFQSFIDLRCPHCYVGKLFTADSHYNLSSILAMPDVCEHCGQDFRIENGFYSAALWISYPIVLVIGVPIFFVLVGLFDFDKAWTFLFLFIFMLTLQPPIMRYSRAILIYMFVPFQSSNS